MVSPAPVTVAGGPVTPVVGEPINPKQAVTGETVPVSFTATTAQPPRPTLPIADLRTRVVAIVGPLNIITAEEVWQNVRQRGREYLSDVEDPTRPGGKRVVRDNQKEKAIYDEELRRIIERELILEDMNARLKKSNSLYVIDNFKDMAEKAASRQIEDFKRRQPGIKSNEEFEMMLATQGMSIPVIKRSIERQMIAFEYTRSLLEGKGKAVGIGDIRAYYESHPEAFRIPDRVKWLDIFISVNKFQGDRLRAYNHALAVQGQALTGVDFVALSKKYDQGLAAYQGGEGNGHKRGEISPSDVESTVWSLKPGEVSPLIEAPAGYHIVKVVERDMASIRPFDDRVQAEIREKLKRELHEQEYRKFVDELWWNGVVRVVDATPR